MNSQEFMTKVREHQPVLETYLQQWHPRSRAFVYTDEQHSSAPGAQHACNRVCGQIQKQPAVLPPVEAFKAAVEAADVIRTYTLLQEAYFGLPERMDWREHTGAKEAVGLLEDPPDDVVWPDED